MRYRVCVFTTRVAVAIRPLMSSQAGTICCTGLPNTGLLSAQRKARLKHDAYQSMLATNHLL
jgi:hypothetical protein